MSARKSGVGWMFSVKSALLSTAVLSTAVALKLSAPSIRVLLVSEIPRIYDSVLSWLTPPYLYFVINGIIISIAASSRFQKAADGAEPAGALAYPSQAKAPTEIPQDYVHVPQAAYEVAKVEAAVPETWTERTVPAEYHSLTELRAGVEVPKLVEKEQDEDEEEFIISRSSWTPSRRESMEVPPEEKPLVSGRFGGRRNAKPSPEGKALGVARPKRNGTFESTWKTITDGRPVPLTRHLKKSDTFDVQARAPREPSPVRKSETFDERRNGSDSPSPGSSGGRLRASPSQDELNRRVEAFIKKFNEEMRLQRQDSFQQYLDMVNRGSY